MKLLITPRMKCEHASEVEVSRLLARVVAAAMFAFWGAFFLEHMWEWFLVPLPDVPPVSVWVSQLFHFFILVGLAIGFKWELPGAAIVIVASVLFLIDKAPGFIPLSILPACLYLYCWHLERHTGKTTCAS